MIETAIDGAKAINQYGVSFVLFLVLLFCFWAAKKMFKLQEIKEGEHSKMTSKMFDSQERKDEVNTKTQEKFVDAINETTREIKLRISSAKEFQGYVRDEHKESQDNQKEIITLIKQVHTQHSSITETLGRINGYKS